MSEDRSYLYGDGLFETVRVDAGVRWLSRHVGRLTASGQALGFPTSVIDQACAALEALESATPGIWRVTMSRPGEGMDWGGQGGVSVRCRLFSPALPPKLGLMAGFYLPDDMLRHHKSTSYLGYVEARRRARLEGFDDALLLSAGGLVGEATAANVIVVLSGRAVTPPVRGIVAGVTRAGLIELAATHGEAIEERAILRAELEHADEIVLVSAGVGAMSAASLCGRALGSVWGERAANWLAEVARR
ncbi:MAG: aminotransferase class IV [Bradymonadaceae bacterium]|nr:aminotransferase class IV [Lujinxingiaceae bacterium]